MIGQVVLFANARPGTGYGHLFRLLPLHRRLHAGGIKSTLLTPLEEPTLAGLGLTDVGSTGGTPISEAQLRADGTPAWFVADTYDHPNELLAMARACGCKLAVVDDHQRITEPAELLVSCSPAATPELYPNHPEESLLLGPAYMPLDTAFQKARERFTVRPSIRKVLVSLGGQDVKNNLPTLIAALEKGGQEGGQEDVEYHFIGDNLPEARPSASRLKSLGWVPNHELARILPDYDLAVISGGTMLHQCCCVGLPSLCLPQVENQRRHARVWQARGATVVCGDERTFTQDILDFRHEGTRQRLSQAGRELVDGQGAERLMQALEYHS